jgi:hypothetical protein
MHTRIGDEGAVDREITRRNVLKAGLAAGLGFGTMALLETCQPAQQRRRQCMGAI